jgi:hypothetical protein
MNEFLKDYYNTASGGNDDADALEKMAQLTLLTKEAEEEGIDLSGLSDDEVMQLADELYGDADGGDAGEQTDTDDLEKEAQAKFEEADFLGRVMAHSMWQELDSIQKEAGSAPLTLIERGKALARGAHGKTLGAVGSKAEEFVGRKLREGGRSNIVKSIVHRLGGAGKTVTEKVRGKDVERVLQRGGNTYREGAKRLARAANIAAQVGTGVGAAGVTGGVGYGGYRGVKALREHGKEKEGSALNSLIEQRAIEHLAAAGYVDQQGNVYGPEKTASDNDFNTVVDRAALELLEQNGYPVQWR